MAADKPFRENWQTSLPFLQGVVRWMNGIAHVLNNISVTSGDTPEVHATPSGIKFVLPFGGADGRTDMGGSWGFKILAIVAHEGEQNPYLHPEDESSSGEESTPRSLPIPFSNLLRDGGEESNSAEEEEPTEFWVKVLGGPAQVLGGREHLYEDQVFEDPLPDGAVLYLRYRITDDEGEPVCEWDEEVNVYDPNDESADNPFAPPEDEEEEEAKGREMLFVIGKIGARYENWVRQDRVGSVAAVATINSSGVFVNPTYEEL